MTTAYVPLTGPPTWQHAACRGEDPELWFPIGALVVNPDGETAVDICRRCPHRVECVEWAAHVDARDGIWGGTTPEQRNPIVARRQRHAQLERQRRQRRLDDALDGMDLMDTQPMARPRLDDIAIGRSVLRGPADADHYRKKVGRYRDRWYVDPLPADDIADADTQAAWPSVSAVKGAYGHNWEYVTLKRVAVHLEDHPRELDGLNLDDRYDRLKQISKSGLRTAGNRGTDVHKMCELMLHGKIVDDRMLNAEARAYRAAVDAFFDDHQPELYAAELVCINRGMNGVGYGGTADAIVRIQDRLYKVDWKSRGKDSDHGAYPEEIAQLGAYTGADYIILDGPRRARMPDLDGGLVVSIRPDGYRVYPIDLGEAWLQWEGCHTWWTRRLEEDRAIGHPWAPVGRKDLYDLIDACATQDGLLALRDANRADWTDGHNQAASARWQALQAAQTPSSATAG